MIPVILESPFMGRSVDPAQRLILQHRNIDYARRAVRDCLLRGEAPLASHLLYTQPGILNDDLPDERTLGIDAGHVWIRFAARVVVYTDYGISGGMEIGIERASRAGIPVEYRTLGG